jgi:DNA-binding CsgD family transcriptional regulator
VRCVIGRELELSSMEDFLVGGTSWVALLLTGGPGIGKTTLWERGLRLAAERGFRVLVSRPSGAEAELQFAGLFDLLMAIELAPVSGLPAPQRRALEAALLRAEPEDETHERFAVAAGFLAVLRALAAESPVLVAVDDLHSLDAATAEVLAFAARRAPDQSCRFLLCRRSGPASGVEVAMGPALLHTADVAPLTLTATRRLLAQCLGLTVRPRTLQRLFDATQGNPLLSLELGRALAHGQMWPAGAEPPVTDLADNPFGTRVEELPRPAREALLATALSGHLSLPQLTAVASPAAVDKLLAAGMLISEDDQVRLAHPLLGVAARRHARSGERQALHLALAGVAGDQTLRARHLALSAQAPDVGVAGSVAAAAAAAGRRGAAHDAAELAEQALRLTPSSSAEYPDRLLVLAQYLVTVGEASRVTELLGPRVGELPAGPIRARAHLLLGEDASLPEHEEHLERALANSSCDAGLRATALATKSLLLAVARVDRIAEAEALAAEAQRLARAIAGPAEHAQQALTWARILRGQQVPDPAGPDAASTPTASLYESSTERPAAIQLAFAGRISAARARLRNLLARADERGETRFGAIITLHLCELELRAGDLRECSRLLDDWAESGALEGVEPEHARCRAMLAVLRGQPDEMEPWVAQALPAAPDGGVWDKWDDLEILRARGIAALFAQQPEHAAAHLRQVWDHTQRAGVADPGAFPVAPDLAEALVWLGKPEDVPVIADVLRDAAQRLDHPWAAVTASRCTAMATLACGYDECAAGQLADAADRYRQLGLRFDRARSLLWLGRAARLARKRSVARQVLETAAAEFAALGAAGWADQAGAELDLLGGGGTVAAGSLTAAEQRVVALAASGLSNKQIARRLFVAVHTVEVHLSHAYAKLGVQSRSQLAGRLTVLSPSRPED